MGYTGKDAVIVTDIGCSGFFDTFFNTHAFHGLHGRALTCATRIKMARPDLNVIVTMGDGGLGFGGAHVLSTCGRNIDLKLLVLNNFNYGMTGGQCSSTTPRDAVVGSGFLNKIEKPMDICQVAGTAGAPYVSRVSTYDKGRIGELKTAIAFEGFSLVDTWGICPGCYSRRNKLSPKKIENPSVVIALAPEGVRRRKKTIETLSAESVVVKAAGVELPPCQASIIEVDFKAKWQTIEDYRKERYFFLSYFPFWPWVL